MDLFSDPAFINSLIHSAILGACVGIGYSFGSWLEKSCSTRR